MERTLTRNRWQGILVSLALLLMAVVPIAALLGSDATPLVQLMKRWVHLLQGHRISEDSVVDVIIFQIRLPRILLAALAGASLSIVGVALQSLLRNPLADPYLLGVSGGAALGASLAILVIPGGGFFLPMGVPLCAFLGGLLTLSLVYRLGLMDGRLSVNNLLLSGIGINAVTGAIILFLTAVVDPVRMSRIVYWLMGTMTSPAFSELIPLAVCLLIGIGCLIAISKEFNLLTLGEDVAHSLGCPVERVKRIVFGATALLTGIVVSFVGPIAFVGILVPHILRLSFGTDHRLLIPAAALGGGIFMVGMDTLARTVLSPAEIPIGVLTALCGGPLFLYLLRTKRPEVLE